MDCPDLVTTTVSTHFLQWNQRDDDRPLDEHAHRHRSTMSPPHRRQPLPATHTPARPAGENPCALLSILPLFPS